MKWTTFKKWLRCYLSQINDLRNLLYMKIDLNIYTVNRKFMRDWIARNPHHELVSGISLIAPSIHCPNLVLTFYAAEIVGFTPELVKSIEGLIHDYHVTEISNQLPGSPFLPKTDDIE